MGDVESAQGCLVVLEDVLVNEFRAYQTLVRLTKEERRVLSLADLNALVNLVAQKETLLGELGRLDAARCAAIEEWARLTAEDGHAASGVRSNGRPAPQALRPYGAGVTLGEILPQIDPPTAGRLKRLREGILALVEQLTDLSQGNRALVNLALERLEAVRDFLISLAQPPAYYQPAGARAVPAEAALALEQWA
jgi:flagellar biosynthesis/type III secretory pathway chaperone